MELYTLNINVNKQRLSFGENKPEIFSGDQSIDFVEFTFTDDTWNFPNIWAIFYRQKGAAYQIALDDNKVMIPAEVMQKRGYVYIGLMATDGENVQTSSVLQYSIRQGVANVETVTPSPSIYEQFLADLDAYQEAIQNLSNLSAVAETLAPGSSATASYLDGVLTLGIPQGNVGPTGNGIQSIAKTGTSGNVDTYTITYTNGSTSTFTVTNGSVTSVDGQTGDVNLGVDEIKDAIDDIAEPVISELSGIETESKAIGTNGTIITSGSTSYRIVKYSVTENQDYWISASSNWGNYLWCFYDENDGVVQLGTRTAGGSAWEEISNYLVTAPATSSYIIIGYHTAHQAAACKTITGYALKKKWENKKWTVVGDSLTEVNTRATKRYYDYVSEETGISIVNMGASGTGYARGADINKAFYQRISSVPADSDVVTIFGSFNDLGSGLSIGTVNDSGTSTLAGCINTTLDNLQTVIPLANIGIVAPTPWETTQPSTSGSAYDYVSMLQAICERRSIPFLDLWHCSNLRPWDADFRAVAYSHDEGSGTHPDENGHKLIAPRFKAFLESLLI